MADFESGEDGRLRAGVAIKALSRRDLSRPSVVCRFVDAGGVAGSHRVPLKVPAYWEACSIAPPRLSPGPGSVQPAAQGELAVLRRREPDVVRNFARPLLPRGGQP